MINKAFWKVYDHSNLTPVAKLVAMRVAASVGPQDNGQDISLLYVHSLLYWVGCSRVQLVAALDELIEKDIIVSFRWVEVKSKTENGEHTNEALLVFVTAVDIDDLDDFDIPSPNTEDIVGGDTAGITRIDPRRARIFAKTEGQCFYCVEASAEHLDHMHPQSRGGTDADENMIGACATCNVQKNDRTVDEYRAWLAWRRKLPNVSEVLFYGERQESAA